MSNSFKKSARYWAFQAISRIEGDKAYSDIVLTNILDKSREFSTEQPLITEIVKGTIKWKKRLDWITKSFLKNPEHVPQEIIWLLWLGIYQIQHMNTPDFAAVNETVNLSKFLKYNKWTKLINAVLRNTLRNAQNIKFPDVDKDPVSYLAVTQSHPEWMVKRWIDQFGFFEAESLCKANNNVPFVTVRVNPLKITENDFEILLLENQFNFEKSFVPGFYRLKKINVKIFHQLIDEGLKSVQDESAGIVSFLCAPHKNDIIIDFCAAPGTKSMHLAELLNDNALILSGEINPSRAGLVKQAASRLGINSVNTIVADGAAFPADNADIVLIDAPCSGLGVLRKKPDLRWNRTLKDISELNIIQQKLLHNAAKILKPNGTIIYSTCTIEKQENEDIVFDFLKHNNDFEIKKPELDFIDSDFITSDLAIRTWPNKHGMDGSFSTRLKKK